MAATVTGIDIGADGLKAVTLRRRRGPDGLPLTEVLAAGRVELGALGRVEENEEKQQLLEGRLRELFGALPVRPRPAVVSLPVRDSVLRYVKVANVPAWKLEMIIGYEAEAYSHESGPSAYDWQVLDLPASAGGTLALLGLAREEAVNRRLALLEASGAGEGEADLAPIGLANAYLASGRFQADETVLLVDVGAESVHVVVQHGAALYFARTLAGGARRFTSALQDGLGLSYPQAERVKLEEGTVDLQAAGGAPRTPRPDETDVIPLASAEPPAGNVPGDDLMLIEDTETEVAEADPRRTRIVGALMREAAGLTAMLEGSLRYCRAQLGIPDLMVSRILLAGGGARLPGLCEFISRRMGLPVELLGPPSAFRTDAPGAAALREAPELYAVALGLALSRLEPGAARLHLLPLAVQARRRFWSRTIYLWYAGAVCAALLALLIYGPLHNRNVVRANQDRLAARQAEAAKEKQQLDQLAAENRRLHAELRDLGQRASSGRDLLMSLLEVKNQTPPSVCLSQFSNVRPQVLPPAARAAAAAGGAPAPPETFVGQRDVYVRGFVRTNQPSFQVARKLVTDYFNVLSRRPLFVLDRSDETTSRELWAESMEDQRLLPPDLAGDNRWKYYEFVHRLRVADELPAPEKPAAASARSAAGGQP